MKITREDGLCLFRQTFGEFNYNKIPLLRFSIPLLNCEKVEHTSEPSIFYSLPIQYPLEIDLCEIAAIHNKYFSLNEVDTTSWEKAIDPILKILNKTNGIEFITHTLASNELELERIQRKKEEWGLLMAFIKNSDEYYVPYAPINPEMKMLSDKEYSERRNKYDSTISTLRDYLHSNYSKNWSRIEYSEDRINHQIELPPYYLERFNHIRSQLLIAKESNSKETISSVLFQVINSQLQRWNQFENYLLELELIITTNADFNGNPWVEILVEQSDSITRLVQEAMNSNINPNTGRIVSFKEVPGIERFGEFNGEKFRLHSGSRTLGDLLRHIAGLPNVVWDEFSYDKIRHILKDCDGNPIGKKYEKARSRAKKTPDI